MPRREKALAGGQAVIKTGTPKGGMTKESRGTKSRQGCCICTRVLTVHPVIYGT